MHFHHSFLILAAALGLAAGFPIPANDAPVEAALAAGFESREAEGPALEIESEDDGPKSCPKVHASRSTCSNHPGCHVEGPRDGRYACRCPHTKCQLLTLIMIRDGG
jgi:hypothetical protein